MSKHKNFVCVKVDCLTPFVLHTTHSLNTNGEVRNGNGEVEMSRSEVGFSHSEVGMWVGEIKNKTVK